MYFGSGIEALCQWQQRAQQLLGSRPSVDEPQEGLGQADGELQVAVSHFLAQFLLVSQCLGVVLDGIAPVSHLEHDVAFLAQGIHQIGHRHARRVGVTAVQLLHVEFAGALVVGQHVHLLGLGLDDLGRGLYRHEQHRREARFVAFGEAFKQLLCLGEFFGCAAVVAHVMMGECQVVEQCCYDGMEILGFLALVC